MQHTERIVQSHAEEWTRFLVGLAVDIHGDKLEGGITPGR